MTLRSLAVLTILKLVFVVPLVSASPSFPTLPAFPEPPPSPLIYDDTLPVPTCAEVLVRLKKYQKDVLDNDQAQLSFIDNVANTAIQWQALLEPLEGQTSEIPVGSFSPLKDYGDKINQVLSWSYDNSAYLAQELDKITVGLEACKIEEL